MSRLQTAPVGQPSSLSLTAQMMKLLLAAPIADALGVAVSFVLHCGERHPEMLRRVLHEPVIRDGFRGTTLLKELNRVAR